MTQLTVSDKLRNLNHDIEGVVIYNQMVTCTAFAILAMFYNTSESKETKDQIPQKEALKYCFYKLQLKDKLVSDGSSIVRTLEDMSVSKCGCR